VPRSLVQLGRSILSLLLLSFPSRLNILLEPKAQSGRDLLTRLARRSEKPRVVGNPVLLSQTMLPMLAFRMMVTPRMVVVLPAGVA
jgi:hypothetical protein